MSRRGASGYPRATKRPADPHVRAAFIPPVTNIRKGIDMKTIAAVLLATVLLAGGASAQTGKDTTMKESEKAKAAVMRTDKGKAAAMQVTGKATVMAIDLESRMVTLKTADGKEVTTMVSPDVKNLKQVNVGDVVTATYTVALAVSVNPAPGDSASAAAAMGMKTAKEGEKPAAHAAGLVSVKTTVEAIDTTANTVTIKGPRGNVRTIAVKDPIYQAKLRTMKIGDIVEITYAESLLIQVEEGKKK